MSDIRSRNRSGSVILPNWRVEDRDLDTSEFRVACWLASHTDHYRQSLSRNRIASALRMSTAKTSSCLDHLVHLGIIEMGHEGQRWVITFDFEQWEQPSRFQLGNRVDFNSHRRPRENH